MVALNLPMPVRRVVASDSVAQNRHRVALQRGPLVYCVEHADNGGKAFNILLPDHTVFAARYEPTLLQGVVSIRAEVPVVTIAADGASVTTANKTITAIPYYAWANRGKGPMQVCLLQRVADVKVAAE